MSNSPIRDFIYRCPSLHVHDVAALFCLVALQESSGPGWVISPAVKDRRIIGLGGMTDEEWAASVARLIAAEELEWVEENNWRGFRVKRFDELQDAMTDFGKRAYFRQKTKESRERKEVAV